jgi:lysophospholipase L1-like esterase
MTRRKRLVFTLSALLLLLLTAEAALRLLGYRYESFFAQAFWWKRFSGQPIYEADPVRFWRLRPHANSDLSPESRDAQIINGLGFRDDRLERQKAPGEFRVTALGDSCTFGDGVETWEAYPNALETMLQQANPGRRIQVINAGVPGYTSYQVRRYLETELLAYQPDLVIVYVGFNDNVPAVNGVTDAKRGTVNRFTWTVQALLGRSRVYQFFKYNLLRFKQRLLPNQRPDERDPEGVEDTIFRVTREEFVENLIAVRRLGDAHGFRTIVVTLPHEFPDEPERNALIRAAAQKGDIPLVDLFPILKGYQGRGEHLFASDGGHPNNLGHRHIAEALFAKMTEMNLPGPAAN